MEVTERRGRVMASDLHLILVDAPPGLADGAVEHVEGLERRWSRFLPSSDISLINAAAGAPVAVDWSTMVLIASMIEAWRVTAGAYDPTILAALVAQGYAASVADPRRTTVLGPDVAGIGFVDGDIRFDLDARTVSLRRGCALDPGGIGKGLAADLCVARLLTDGAAGALVGIGGDLSMGGVAPQPEGWAVSIEHPDCCTETLCTLIVSGGGVATSSTRSRRWTHAGEERHHVIDPSTGMPAITDLAAVTVVARTGWEAEAHATAALCSGSTGVLSYLAAKVLSGIAVGLDGSTLATAELRDLELRAAGASR